MKNKEITNQISFFLFLYFQPKSYREVRFQAWLNLYISVLLAEANCALVTYFMLIAVKATETITDADSFVRE